MNLPIVMILELLFVLNNIRHSMGKSMVPVLSLEGNKHVIGEVQNKSEQPLQFLPFITLIDKDKDKDTSEYWRETEILSLVHNNEETIDYEKCAQSPSVVQSLVRFPSRRSVRPICRDSVELISRRRSDDPCFCEDYPPEILRLKNRTYFHRHKCPCYKRRLITTSTPRRKNRRFPEDKKICDPTENNYQLCPQCPHFSNYTECELFRDSCKERRVYQSEYREYCDKKYGKWRTMFIPADYSQCRCCDECVFYRELDQSCMEDEYSFDTEEFLPVTTIDFRAGCNPYWGHPEQEFRALRCDKILRRCVPVTVPALPNETLHLRRSFRYEPPSGGEDCPISCRGYDCFGGLVSEDQCEKGAFLPNKDQCNCCGRCSAYHQLNQKCAEFKKTIHKVNGTQEIEVEEEFLEPGCDDGLVCRQGRCQDIHTVQTSAGSRRKRDDGLMDANAPTSIEDLKTALVEEWQEIPQHFIRKLIRSMKNRLQAVIIDQELVNPPSKEPCKKELKYFKKKYGPDGHLHYDAPQCTPLWLYAPVQCRRFVCYCSLEDGTFIQGIKVPRVEVSNMNCDCAREKCRTGSEVECDGYGNYKEAVFTPHVEDWGDAELDGDGQIEHDHLRQAPVPSPQRTTNEEIFPTTNRQ